MDVSPIPALAGFTERSVDLGDRTIRYLEGGQGEPLVTVHGGGGLGRELGPVHVRLAASRRVLALELPGWGGSSPEGLTSLRDLGAVVAAFATALELDGYALMGTSIGGAAALWTAIDNPDAVVRLVLEAPAAFREGAPRPGEFPAVRPDGARMPPPDPAQLAFMASLTELHTDPELVRLMPECQVPTLTLLGTDDPMFPPRFATDYKRLAVGSVALVYAASHDIKGDRPDAFVAIVEDFLTRGPAFVVSATSTLIHA